MESVNICFDRVEEIEKYDEEVKSSFYEMLFSKVCFYPGHVIIFEGNTVKSLQRGLHIAREAVARRADILGKSQEHQPEKVSSLQKLQKLSVVRTFRPYDGKKIYKTHLHQERSMNTDVLNNNHKEQTIGSITETVHGILKNGSEENSPGSLFYIQSPYHTEVDFYQFRSFVYTQALTGIFDSYRNINEISAELFCTFLDMILSTQNILNITKKRKTKSDDYVCDMDDESDNKDKNDENKWIFPMDKRKDGLQTSSTSSCASSIENTTLSTYYTSNIVIVNHAECMSLDLQLRLRKKMESCQDHLQLFFLTRHPDSLDITIHSRCLFISSVRPFMDEQRLLEEYPSNDVNVQDCVDFQTTEKNEIISSTSTLVEQYAQKIIGYLSNVVANEKITKTKIRKLAQHLDISCSLFAVEDVLFVIAHEIIRTLSTVNQLKTMYIFISDLTEKISVSERFQGSGRMVEYENYLLMITKYMKLLNFQKK